MKIKIMAIDDEYIELITIQKIINDNFDDIDVVLCDLPSGAISLFEKEKPQIVIMDIEMPQLNGLELTKIMVSINPDVKIIIHSAYGYFEYAQEALKLGAVDYLLKPTTVASIVNTIKKFLVKLNIEEKRRKKDEDIYDKENAAKLKKIIEREVILGIINNNIDYIKEQYNNIIDLENIHGCCIIIKSDNKDDLYLTAESLKKNIDCLCHNYTQHKMLIIALNSSHDTANKFMGDIDYYINTVVKKFDGPSISVGRYFNKFSDAYVSYTEAISKLSDNICKPVNMELERNEFYKEIIKENTSEHFIEDFFDKICNMFSGNVHLVKFELLDTLVYLRRYVFENMYVELNIVDLFENGSAIDSLSLLRKWFINAVERVKNDLKNNLNKKYSLIVNQVVEYIETNYNKNISLEDIAHKFHINSAYLSRLFKRETNSNFIDYLNCMRIKKAVKLIKYTTKTIKEISEEVGYSSQTYFSKVFKKIMGKPAGDYKK